jgi:hypothetical protein
MRKHLAGLRNRAVLISAGAALLACGAGFSAAAATGIIGTQNTADVTTVTTPATSSSSEPASSTTAADTPAPTVAAMTSAPAPAPAVAPAPTSSSQPARSGVGTTDAEGNYTPVPQQQIPGGPPIINDYAPLPPAPKMPGEPGYVPPAG